MIQNREMTIDDYMQYYYAAYGRNGNAEVKD